MKVREECPVLADLLDAHGDIESKFLARCMKGTLTPELERELSEKMTLALKAIQDQIIRSEVCWKDYRT
jgi:hypothetical protein